MKSIMVFGAVAVILLMVSSATAVPHVQNAPMMNSIKNVEQKEAIYEKKLDEIADKLEVLINSRWFVKIKTIIEQRFGKDILENIDSSKVIKKAKAVLRDTGIKEILREKSNPKSVTQSFKNRLQRTFDSIVERKGTNPLLQQSANRESLVQKLTDMFGNMDDTVRTRFQSFAKSHPLGQNIDRYVPGGLLLTLVLTILTEFYVYVDFFSELHSINLRIITKLFFISVVINVITNPAINFIYYFIYDDVPVLEHMVFIIEIYMIFILFNALFLRISFEEATDLSQRANEFSYSFCKDFWNDTLTS